MLGSGAHVLQDRRNRRIAVKKAASSSRVSLLSGVTASSSGSSGSGSTITQESVSRPRLRNAKTNSNPKGKRQKTATNGAFTKERNSPRKSKGGINVFAFLDNDQSRASLIQKYGKSAPVSDHEASVNSGHEESDADSAPRSLHSDSGISLNDSASDHDSSKIARPFGRQLDTLEEEQSSNPGPPIPTRRRNTSRLKPIARGMKGDHPEWFYYTSGWREDACTPAVAIANNDNPAAPDDPELSGYELLASRLCCAEASSNSLPPLYRRFGSLNHRILLQLQDEIAEMEEDLQIMDRADACERAARHETAAPASRRLDWQWRGSELHARRLDLLGRIYLKVEQYSKGFQPSTFQTLMLRTIQIKHSLLSNASLKRLHRHRYRTLRRTGNGCRVMRPSSK
jgi:hypothetical protein